MRCVLACHCEYAGVCVCVCVCMNPHPVFVCLFVCVGETITCVTVHECAGVGPGRSRLDDLLESLGLEDPRAG